MSILHPDVFKGQSIYIGPAIDNLENPVSVDLLTYETYKRFTYQVPKLNLSSVTLYNRYSRQEGTSDGWSVAEDIDTETGKGEPPDINHYTFEGEKINADIMRSHIELQYRLHQQQIQTYLALGNKNIIGKKKFAAKMMELETLETDADPEQENWYHFTMFEEEEDEFIFTAKENVLDAEGFSIINLLGRGSYIHYGNAYFLDVGSITVSIFKKNPSSESWTDIIIDYPLSQDYGDSDDYLSINDDVENAEDIIDSRAGNLEPETKTFKFDLQKDYKYKITIKCNRRPEHDRFSYNPNEYNTCRCDSTFTLVAQYSEDIEVEEPPYSPAYSIWASLSAIVEDEEEENTLLKQIQSYMALDKNFEGKRIFCNAMIKFLESRTNKREQDFSNQEEDSYVEKHNEYLSKRDAYLVKMWEALGATINPPDYIDIFDEFNEIGHFTNDEQLYAIDLTDANREYQIHQQDGYGLYFAGMAAKYIAMQADPLGQYHLASTAVNMLVERKEKYNTGEPGDKEKPEYILITSLLKTWKNLKTDSYIRLKKSDEEHEARINAK